jgi:hypothetical protein
MSRYDLTDFEWRVTGALAYWTADAIKRYLKNPARWCRYRSVINEDPRAASGRRTIGEA